MADHIQDQILDYYQGLIASGGTAAGANVYVDRVDPLPANKLPAVLLQAEGEDVDIPSGSLGYPRTQLRNFSFSVHAVVAAATGYGKAARTLAMQIEKLICAALTNQQAGGIARGGVHLVGTEFQKDGEGDKPAYAVVQTWRASYVCQANAPDTPL